MRWLLHIFSCLLAFVGWCQKAEVSLTANTKNVEIGETIELTVKSNVTGQVKIVYPDEFIMGYIIMQGKETELNTATGKLITFYSSTQNGAFKENGTFSLTAYITNKNKVYKSNTITVKVEKKAVQDEEISAKTLRQPVFGLIKRSKTKIYEGEPLILESKIYSRIFTNFMLDYADSEIDGKAETHLLESPRVLYRDKETFRGNNFYTVSNAKKLVFLSAPGKYKVKPFEAILQYDTGGYLPDQIALTSLSTSVEVLPLPNGAPKEFIGAVGKFELESNLSQKTGKEGDVIRLQLTISGAGNLHNIETPKLKLPKGIAVYGDPEIVEKIAFGTGGAEGEITYTYNLQLLSGGKIKLPGAVIAYFDPEQKKYVSVKSKAYQLDVTGSVQTLLVADDAESNQHKEEESMAFMEQSSDEQINLFESKWFWPGVFSPVLFALFGGLFWTRKEQITGKVVEKNHHRKTGAKLRMRLQEIKAMQGDEKEAIFELELLLRSFIQLFPESKRERCSKDELLQVLRENKQPEKLIEQTSSLLIRCEEARYSIFAPQQLQQLVGEAEQVLNQLV